MFRLAICDDDKEEHARLKQLFIQLMKCTSYTFDTHYFFSGEELLKFYKEESSECPFHFLILDIEMNGISGIETARKIRSLPDRNVQIIFLTSYPEYMLESFDVQTFQYLIKPLSYEVFHNKIMSLCNYIAASINRFLIIKSETEQIVLKNSEVIALVKIKHSLIKNKLRVITLQQQYSITGTLMEYAAKLGYPFLPVHRSIIVNLEHIRKFTAISVLMSNGDQLPVGRSQSKKIKEAYARYIISPFTERG